MRFSVLTITFNAAAYLKETLQSVASQAGVDFEHLVWDGGSSDNTLDIARSFPHCKIFEGKDGGIADAMNRIAELAQGDFLIHLHADDLLAGTDSLKRVDRVLKLHPQVEWLYGRAHIIDASGRQIRTTPYEPFSFKRLQKYNFITHPSVFISRQLFRKAGGFRTDWRYCMDYDLWLRLAKIATPFALSSPLSCFREHPLSLSTHEPFNVTDEAYRVRNQHITSLLGRLRSTRTWKKRRKKLLRVE